MINIKDLVLIKNLEEASFTDRSPKGVSILSNELADLTAFN